MTAITRISVVSFVAMLCSCPVPRTPQTTDLRLDMVARSLGSAEVAYDARWNQNPPPDPPAMRELELSLHDAQQSLANAERATDVWHSDPRVWMRVRPCLADDLMRVDLALEAVGLLPPPGLIEAFPPPSDPCVDTSYRRARAVGLKSDSQGQP